MTGDGYKGSSTSGKRDAVTNRKRGPFNFGSEGDILDQLAEKTPEARPFTSPGEGTTSSKPVPSWLLDTTPADRSAGPESLAKHRPATGSGASKPPLYIPSRHTQAASEIGEEGAPGEDISDIFNERGSRKVTQPTPPLGLANITGD